MLQWYYSSWGWSGRHGNGVVEEGYKQMRRRAESPCCVKVC